MSCNYYLHNDSAGGSKYISGTTCSGTEAYYTLTLGEQVCMDDSKPLINLNGLVVSGSCLPVTPTPSTTPYSYCYYSADTVYFGTFQCPNNGVLYQDVYGKMTLYATIDGVIVSSHPDLVFVVSNGTEYETVTILDGQEFTEFVFPKVNFYYTETGCELEYLPDWEVYTPPTTRCLLFTPTPTNTPTVTPTMTQTPTNTPTSTQYFGCVVGLLEGGTVGTEWVYFPCYEASTSVIVPAGEIYTACMTPGTTPLAVAGDGSYGLGGSCNPFSVTQTATRTPTPTPTTTLTSTPTKTPAPSCDVNYNVLVTPSTTSSPTPTPTRLIYEYHTTFSGFSSQANACASGQTCERILYTNENPLTPGAVMYTDSTFTTPFNGGGLRYALNLNCSGTWRAAQITTVGVILSINTSC